MLTKEYDIGGARVDKELIATLVMPQLGSTKIAYLGGLLDTGVVFCEANESRVHNLANLDCFPVPSHEGRILAFSRWVVQQLLQGLLRERRLPRGARRV